MSNVCIFRLFRNIRHGQLTIRTRTHTYVFPEEPHPGNTCPELTAGMNVVDPAFWLRLCFMSDLGFAESYMFGEVECDSLVDVFSVSAIFFGPHIWDTDVRTNYALGLSP